MRVACRAQRWSVVLLVLLTGLRVSAQSAAPAELPDTPAGKRFAAWLEAGNSLDHETLWRFFASMESSPTTAPSHVDRMTSRQFGLFEGAQGFEFGAVLSAPSPDRIAVALRSKRTGDWTRVSMAVDSKPPHNLLGFGVSGTEAPAGLLPKTKLNDDEIRQRCDALIDDLVAKDAFSGVILVARDGQPIYERAAGLASRAWDVPNRMDTRFNVASISKMFTAVAVAQLVERGKLSYDDTLAKALPDHPNAEVAGKVTIRHLLSHTSGLTEQRSTVDGSVFKQGFRTVKENMADAANDTLAFEPGARLAYSSYGYLVLGAVIEHASGQDYYDYVRKHIYRPAGMNDADSYELDADPPNLATGYVDPPRRGEPRTSNVQRLPVKGLPYGLGYATAGDLVRFSTALREHKLLNAASLETVWTGVKEYSEPESQYGYGFIVKRYNGTRIVGHGGGWVGITNKFDFYPDLGYTVVILNNIDSAPNAIAYKLREWITQGRTP